MGEPLAKWALPSPVGFVGQRALMERCLAGTRSYCAAFDGGLFAESADVDVGDVSVREADAFCVEPFCARVTLDHDVTVW